MDFSDDLSVLVELSFGMWHGLWLTS